MRLLQFSTSHYCRKARLALGYKKIPYEVQNLTPGLHRFTIKPLTGTTTTPVLLPEHPDQPQAIGDSTTILQFLETYQPDPPLVPASDREAATAWMLEDWLDESIGTATRFVYYQFRVGPGKALDPSPASQLVIQIVRRQYGITETTAQLASHRITTALQELHYRWEQHPYLVGDHLSVADITAAALLTPLLKIPVYRDQVPWLVHTIEAIHQRCGESVE